MFENIPHELRQYRQWILWKLVERPGQKPTKVPINAQTGYPASVTEPNDWCSYDEAIANAHKASGIGFVFTKNDPFAGIDLDDTHGDKEAFARQQKIYAAFDSYSELSPSGNGLHIIIKGDIPVGRRRSSVEIYSNERFFTMTGSVVHNAPIAERDELLNLLFDEMGGPAVVHNYGEDKEEKEPDEEIIKQACGAANGVKFAKLLAGDWQNDYPSQSEADFAFVDIVAFYTQNKEQIRRIFRASELGQTPKDGYQHRGDRAAYVEYMVNKSFDRQLPPIDIDGLRIAIEQQFAEKRAGAGEPGGTPAPCIIDHASGKGTASGTLHDAEASPISFPPGLLGELAQYIYDASPRPVREIALTGAIGLLAGITGRAYNISGTGLNQYVLLIAKTGRGKEAIASGIAKLMKAVSASVPASKDFVGPTEIASSPAILKWLAERPVCYCLVGEFGLKLKEMSSPNASTHSHALMRSLLDLYNKSGAGNVVGSMAYSDKANNTHVVNSPSFTLLGETTPSRLYENVNEGMIADGLLPRFMVVEYHGPRTPYNEAHKDIQPPLALVQKVADLAGYCLSLSHNGQVLEVPTDKDAKDIFNRFNDFCDAQINDESLSLVAHELWNRAHIKAMKLAALYAVGTNYLNPVIVGPMAQMACDNIAGQTWALKSRFDNGEVGGGSVDPVNNEDKQIEAMVRIITEWSTGPYDICKKYRVREDMYKDKVFPFNALVMRFVAMPVFKRDRQGPTAAVKRTFALLIENGDIAEINQTQCQQKYGKRARLFCILNAERFVEN